MKLFVLTSVVLLLATLVAVSIITGTYPAIAQAPHSVPTDIAAANGENPGEVNLTWEGVPGTNYYRIGWIAESDYRAAGDDWLERFAFVDIKSASSYTLTRLIPGELYWFIVGSAQVRFGQAEWSAWKSLVIAGEPGTCPSAATTGTSPETAGTPTPTPTPPGDYDSDNDGLIEISNLFQLDAIRHDLNGQGSSNHKQYVRAFPEPQSVMGCPASGCNGYELMLNLDFNESLNNPDPDAYWHDSHGWTPIGDTDPSLRFNATFDGNHHTISNLFINWPDSNEIGLFRSTTAASTIRNLNLEHASVTGNMHVGILTGFGRGSVSNISTSGQVNANHDNAGGIMGSHTGPISQSRSSTSVTSQRYNAGGIAGTAGAWENTSITATITDSFATGSVKANESRAGGLIGRAANTTVTASYATGTVTAKNQSGGLIGETKNTTIRAGYATGSVTGRYTTYLDRGKRRQSRDGTDIGGLIGKADDTTVIAAYSTASVSGAKTVAGLIGSSGGGSVRNSYTAGRVTYPTSSVWNGLSGSGSGFLSGEDTVVVNSYWDTQASGQSRSRKGTGKTTLELQTPTSNTGIYVGWNASWWDFGSPRQYPVLIHRNLSTGAQRR